MWSTGISSGAPPPPPGQWGVSGQPQQQQSQQQSQQNQSQNQSQQQKHDIFVGNLAFSTTEEHLHQAFSEIGRIVKVRMVTDLETGKPRGFAFIEFEDPQAALSAIRNMNDYELNGRRIRVNFSNSSHLETMAEKLGMKMSSQSSQGQTGAGGQQGKKGATGGAGATTDASSGNPSTSNSTSNHNHNIHNETGSQAVANSLKTMSKGEMYDVIKKLKEIADSDPDEARKLISGHPQLPEAILFLMGKLDMIQTPVGTNVLDMVTPNLTVAPLPPMGGANHRLPPPDILPPLGVAPPRTDPRAKSKAPKTTPPPSATLPPPSSTTKSTGGTASRPADPRARSDPRARNQPPPPQQQQQQQQPPQPPLPIHLPPHHHPSQIPPPTMAPPPLPPFGMVPPKLEPLPPTGIGGVVAGLDPRLEQEVMRLTEQQIAQLPLDKQQGILALRQQITNAMS